MRRAIGWVLAMLVLSAGLILWRAPQVAVLVGEGFPGAVWPASGSFAPVAGASVVTDPPLASPPPDEALIRLAESGGRALLFSQDGVLRAEAYGEGVDREILLNSYSMVKSLVGALVLRAVADGKIVGLETDLRDILGPTAPGISVGAALSMTSGLVMAEEPPKGPQSLDDEGGYSAWGPLARLHAFGIRAVLPDLRVDPALTGAFHYQSANTALLGLVLETVYRRPLPDILSNEIWSPAGAATAQWRLTPAGDGVSAYCCLYARAIDWLKVGEFLLHNGRAEPFLPPDLWRAFILPDLLPQVRQQGSYGWHLRHDVLDRPGAGIAGPFAYMTGLDGQAAYLIPGSDAVVVRFGAQVQLLHSTIYDLFPLVDLPHGPDSPSPATP